MTYLPGLVLALGVLWMTLSGETAPLFLALGAASVSSVIWLVLRLRVLDRDASPYHRIVQAIAYLIWLAGEIAKSNLAVMAKVLGPRHAIDPAVVRVPSRARTDLGRVLFANSITLTPGTVTLEVEGDHLIVHALVRESASPDSFVDMSRRSARAAEGKA